MALNTSSDPGGGPVGQAGPPENRSRGRDAVVVSPGASGGAGAAPAVRGRTTIADGVVEKIAGMAAREVPGVHALGGGLARTLGAVRDRVPGGRPNVGRGVRVEVGERQTALDLDIVVEYGVRIPEVAGEVRENVVAAVERMTGLEVVEVNIAVNDVHLPDDDEESAPARVE
ncbi:Asp23/Gls24 family envelope stress response protein [Streptomyces durbertensis]|uniref:Asp23/Gls24 family envelope stress response protein n=1 Tax=Streptomyces durbertensis TaxID=2448886 RepID=A0ABR6EDA6_9ACTN|nr:Asp23/Gls24 family envelope stress response protein [Streptomyces durbertensis]MBB1242489.1 Asp23/Gls24 family envelope stress response protein [Streptomyces durbertensis]